ncbi:MFS general substrate transporter [Hortaea werneckii]|nr:MFS general substrate transporter [Hortaea werneckii]KAI7663979.1 MFS general substrate transporter [Hortaea werneckii]
MARNVDSRTTTGTWIPAYVPSGSGSSRIIAGLLVFCSIITSTTFGYDGSMLNGLNILPEYTDYFHLTSATTGLQTSAVFIGGCLAGLCWGNVVDYAGRRQSLFWAAIITLSAVILQTAAQNVAMCKLQSQSYTLFCHASSAQQSSCTWQQRAFTHFAVVIARILIGFGTAASGCGGPPYLAETLPLHWRGWGLGIFNDCYYVGGLVAAGVTCGTAKLQSTWAWRAPSLVQGLFSLICIVILPFLPESPRWLAYRGHRDAAHTVLAQTYADGDRNSPVVIAALKEIIDTLEYEKSNNEKLCFRTPSARRRIALACSAAVFSTISGNVIASYYIGPLLTLAGITSTKVQLEVNIILNAWSLVCALCGTCSVDRLGRKTTALASATTLTVIIFIEGALTKVFGTSNNDSGIYATVASVFLFMGAYSFGWTPLLYLYPPEVLNYPIRAVGVGLFQFVANATAVLIVFTMPIALDNIGYITYFINGAWDVLVIIIIAVFWVETKGKTLEELDVVFEGEKHSDAPELVLVYRGEASVPTGKNVQTVEGRQSSQQSSGKGM